MIDDFIKDIWKRNGEIGLVFGYFLPIAYILANIIDAINNLLIIRTFSYDNPILNSLLFIFGLLFIYKSKDENGHVSLKKRVFYRFGFIIIFQVLFVNLLLFKLISFENIIFFNQAFGFLLILLFLILNYADIFDKKFKILLFEFSNSASKSIPNKRNITYYSQRALKKEIGKLPIFLTHSDEVIIDDDLAISMGINAKATAVVYGIYTEHNQIIDLDLHFIIVKKPKYYHPINMEEKSLPIEEFESKSLQILIGRDYANAICFLLGLFYYSQKKFSDAITCFSKSIECYSNQEKEFPGSEDFLSTEFDSICLFLGNSYFYIGDYYSALDIYKKSFEKGKKNPKILHNIGIIEFIQNNLSKSISYFSTALIIDKTLNIAYRNRGYVLIQEERYSEALDDLLKYIQLIPYDAEALELIGLCYSNMGKHKISISYYLRSLKISKNLKLLFCISAEHHINRQKFLCTVSLLILMLIPKYCSLAFASLADYYCDYKYYRVAEFLYSLAIILNPKNYELFFLRSYNRTHLGNIRGSIRDLQRVIDLDQNFIDAFFNLGNAYSSLGEYELAYTCFTKIIEKDPNAIDALINRAQVLLQLSQFENALNDANRCTNINSDIDTINQANEIIKICHQRMQLI
jgi:tetratricopeptide (TPR) repeat protein